MHRFMKHLDDLAGLEIVISRRAAPLPVAERGTTVARRFGPLWPMRRADTVTRETTGPKPQDELVSWT